MNIKFLSSIFLPDGSSMHIVAMLLPADEFSYLYFWQSILIFICDFHLSTLPHGFKKYSAEFFLKHPTLQKIYLQQSHSSASPFIISQTLHSILFTIFGSTQCYKPTFLTDWWHYVLALSSQYCIIINFNIKIYYFNVVFVLST